MRIGNTPMTYETATKELRDAQGWREFLTRHSTREKSEQIDEADHRLAYWQGVVSEFHAAAPELLDIIKQVSADPNTKETLLNQIRPLIRRLENL